MATNPSVEMVGEESPPEQRPAGDVRLSVRGPLVKVSAPYDAEFVAGAKRIMGAYFTPSNKCWVFPIKHYREVLDLCGSIYGEYCIDERVLLAERGRLLNRISEIDQTIADRKRLIQQAAAEQ